MQPARSLKGCPCGPEQEAPQSYFLHSCFLYFPLLTLTAETTPTYTQHLYLILDSHCYLGNPSKDRSVGERVYEKALGSGSHVVLLITGQEALLGLCFLLTEGLPLALRVLGV